MQKIRETQEIHEIREIQERPDAPVVTITSETGWQSPEYEVVETALEVTAYALATR